MDLDFEMFLREKKPVIQPNSVYYFFFQAGGSSALLMDLAANEKSVHADFFNGNS